MPTLEITKFGGPLTRRNTGHIDSGLAKYSTSWGYDPYSKPGNLTWLEQPVSILNGPLVMAMKARTESRQTIVYALVNGGSILQITANSGTAPNLDRTSMVGTLDTTNVDVYSGGGGITFYGGTEKILTGGNNYISKVSFDGSGASVIAAPINGVPRPFANFLGRVYVGNGANIMEIDSTETISNAAKLSPALPSGITIDDLDVSPDGNYLQIIASRSNPLNTLGGTTFGDMGTISALDSYKFHWNGVDSSYSAYENYAGLVLSGNLIHGQHSYTFGYDYNGTALFLGSKKIVSLPETSNPQANALFSSGNVIGFASAEYETTPTRFRAAIYNFGKYDEETPRGLFRLLRQNATVRDDIISVPACIKVTNHLRTASTYGVASNLGGVEKIYYSTLEASSTLASSSVATLWRFGAVASGAASIVAGVYETQTQLFSKRVSPQMVRLYTEPLVGGNDFNVELIGSGGSVISGGGQTFTVGTTATAGDEMVRYNPTTAPTYAMGLRITNASVTGVANWTALKAEIDYNEAGV